MSAAARKLLAGVVAVLGFGAMAGNADAYIYWANQGLGTIGRANLDGTGFNESFINSFAGGAVVIAGQFIYWDSAGSIGRANLDGSDVNPSFITGLSNGFGMAVNGQYIYWANFNTDTIGRANLDGSGVNQNFITTATNPAGVAVNGQYIYWADEGFEVIGTTIGRANLDGSGVDQTFISGATFPKGLAINGQYLYWANGASTIARANLDGSGENLAFINGADNPFGVAVDGQYVYWSNVEGINDTIGRANLDGSGVNQNFIALPNYPTGLPGLNMGTEPTAIGVDPYPVPTTLVAKPLLAGGTVSATLTRSDTGAPLARQQLVFTAGSSTLCTATTDSSGTASCTMLAELLPAVLNLGYTASYTATNLYAASTSHAGLL